MAVVECSTATNTRIARFRQCRDLIREIKAFVKYKTEVMSKVSSVERKVMYFSKLFLKSDKKKFSLGAV